MYAKGQEAARMEQADQVYYYNIYYHYLYKYYQFFSYFL